MGKTEKMARRIQKLEYIIDMMCADFATSKQTKSDIKNYYFTKVNNKKG